MKDLVFLYIFFPTYTNEVLICLSTNPENTKKGEKEKTFFVSATDFFNNKENIKNTSKEKQQLITSELLKYTYSIDMHSNFTEESKSIVKKAIDKIFN